VLEQPANHSGLTTMNRELIAKVKGQERSKAEVFHIDKTKIRVPDRFPEYEQL
jgi:hypothetical protein